jgi:hypothetical protein
MSPMPQLHKQILSHTLHIYRLNMKNVNISLSTISYKTHINIVLCAMMRCCSRMPEMFLLGKNITMTNKMPMLQLSFTWMYAMPHLHKQLILHTLYIYKLNMKHVSISLSRITYKRHTNMVLCAMVSGRAHDVRNVSTWKKHFFVKGNTYDKIKFHLNVSHARSTQAFKMFMSLDMSMAEDMAQHYGLLSLQWQMCEYLDKTLPNHLHE